MAMVIFYPWLQIGSEIQAGPYTLAPWTRGNTIAHGHWSVEVQNSLNLLLSPFHQGPKASITHAVIVLRNGHQPFDDLEENERGDFFAFSELVTFAGLASRRFFDHSGYLNSSNFTPILQAFREPGSGVSLSCRRRDGFNDTHVSAEFYREDRPRHVVHLYEHAEIDSSLLISCVRAQTEKSWEDFSLSIPLFNLANTDDSTLRERVETVLLVSAFERLLGASANEKDLAEKFVDLFRVGNSLPATAHPRIDPKRFSNVASVREAWIRDLFRTRGSLAHGHSPTKYPSVWPIAEHLLLGAFAFPLLAKMKLTRSGLYKFSERDQVSIKALERLACADLFRSPNDEEQTWPWRKILADVEWDDIENELIAKATAMSIPNND